MIPSDLQPYPGLRPYQEDEKDNFFGRSDDSNILVDKLLTNRLTLLFAASGVGKSSLLNASVLPHLKDPFGENLTVACHNDWVTMPAVDGLMSAIQAVVPNAVAYQGEDSIPDLLAFCCLFTRHPFVLVLDQFEEFFRHQRSTEDFESFIDQLSQVILNSDLPVKILISMREDFALELNAFKPKLPALLFENYYRLNALKLHEAIDAIIMPAEKVGFEYDEELVNQLINDLSDADVYGALFLNKTSDKLIVSAVLQIVCLFLWSVSKENANKRILLRSYIDAGGAAEIFSGYIDREFNSLNNIQKNIASKALAYLTPYPGFRVKYTSEGLARKITDYKKNQIEDVLNVLTKKRILKIITGGREKYYDLYHDMYFNVIKSWKLNQQELVDEVIEGHRYSVFLSVPSINWNIDDLSESLRANRKGFLLCENKFLKSVIPTDELSLIKEMLTRHVLINMLIPLIKLKGYDVNYLDDEFRSIQDRIKILRAKRSAIEHAVKRKDIVGSFGKVLSYIFNISYMVFGFFLLPFKLILKAIDFIFGSLFAISGKFFDFAVFLGKKILYFYKSMVDEVIRVIYSIQNFMKKTLKILHYELKKLRGYFMKLLSVISENSFVIIFGFGLFLLFIDTVVFSSNHKFYLDEIFGIIGSLFK